MQIVIFDTEFTAWEGSVQHQWSLDCEHHEVIKIAAVKVALSLSGAQLVFSFNTLVKPVINSTLSDYIIQLTGIEQHISDNMGVDYQAAHLCSGELASHLGADLQGHIHNALYDVRSIALALNQWMQKG